jgi:hypothetical protein
VNVLGTLSRASPGWLAVVVLGSAVTYLAAQNLAAFVPRRLSTWRGSLVQLSTAFVGLAMPPTVGHVAVNAATCTASRWTRAPSPPRSRCRRS